MPRYRVLEKSLIGNQIFEPGTEVDYDGLPSGNLEPLDDAGRAKALEAVAASKASLDKMIQDYQPPTGIDPEKFAASIAKAVSMAIKDNADHGDHAKAGKAKA